MGTRDRKGKEAAMRHCYIVIVTDKGRKLYWCGAPFRFVSQRRLAAQFASSASAEAVARALRAELKVQVDVAPLRR